LVVATVLFVTADDQANVYGAVPPVTVFVDVPSQTPLQDALVSEPDNVKPPPVLVIVITAVDVLHNVASVTVTVYVPGHRPVAVAALPPLGAHEYVYGADPPVTLETVAVPLQLEQVALVDVVVNVNPTAKGQVIHVVLLQYAAATHKLKQSPPVLTLKLQVPCPLLNVVFT